MTYVVQQNTSYELVDLDGLKALFHKEWEEFVENARADDLEEPDEGDVRDFILESFLGLRSDPRLHDYFEPDAFASDTYLEVF